MRSKLLPLVALALIAHVPVRAGDRIPQVSVSQLDKTIISVGQFKIRITKFKTSVMKIGNGQFDVEVENTSRDYQTFSPRRLSLIVKDDIQLDTIPTRTSLHVAFPSHDPKLPSDLADIRIAPAARVKETCGLTGKVRLPARLFYDEELIAVITE